MAVSATPAQSSLQLTVQTGTDASGNPTYDRYSFNRVKAVATDQNVYDVAMVLAGLLAHPLASVERSITFTLTEA